MSMIRPITDLQDNFAEISRFARETAQPVFLTKDGYGDMVVLSMEAYEKMRFDIEVDIKLQEAEMVDKLTGKRYTPEEVWKSVSDIIGGSGSV
ncbi:MAG: type II toxin-antitoxin system Phd/YefM family antitoxin [Defluviitaleaceae bacterium]|nr:type II toxin-antitoxin system Phd/YefM family antitoxin [Defluviitaleaceae bacterium]